MRKRIHQLFSVAFWVVASALFLNAFGDAVALNALLFAQWVIGVEMTQLEVWICIAVIGIYMYLEYGPQPQPKP